MSVNKKNFQRMEFSFENELISRREFFEEKNKEEKLLLLF